MKNALKAQWYTLNERERLAVIVGGLALIAALVYAGIYSPIHAQFINKSKLLVEKQQTLQWMQEVTPQLKGQQSATPISNTQLLALISKELKENQFKQYPYDVQQSTTGDIQLSFDNIPYLPFIHWLWTLHDRYTIHTKQMQMEKANKPGVIRLSLTLSVNKA